VICIFNLDRCASKDLTSWLIYVFMVYVIWLSFFLRSSISWRSDVISLSLSLSYLVSSSVSNFLCSFSKFISCFPYLSSSSNRCYRLSNLIYKKGCTMISISRHLVEFWWAAQPLHGVHLRYHRSDLASRFSSQSPKDPLILRNGVCLPSMSQVLACFLARMRQYVHLPLGVRGNFARTLSDPPASGTFASNPTATD
jgi:hypothetical protein